MCDSYTFAVDVFRTVCARLADRAADLRLLVETGSSFEEWLIWEAFLACKFCEASYPFCEVVAKPTYSSEGVADDSNEPDQNLGDLRVGGPNDGADHCWLFAEFVLLRDGNSGDGKCLRKLEADADKLKRLGWKKSASLLVVVVASKGDALTVQADARARLAVGNQPALADPFVCALPGGGSVVVTAFDVKRDPTHTLTGSAH